MNVLDRGKRLKTMIEKQAQATPPKIKDSTLFPKLKPINKPPDLSKPSQPKLDIHKTDSITLPKMKTKGYKPKFESKLNNVNPYNKS